MALNGPAAAVLLKAGAEWIGNGWDCAGRHTDAATRTWVNNGHSRALASLRDDAQSSNVVSIDALTDHSTTKVSRVNQHRHQNATVMLGEDLVAAAD